MFHRYLARAAGAAFLAAILSLSQQTAGQETAKGAQRPLLSDTHKTKGVKCGGCHAEKPPADAVPTVKCLDCHGGSVEKLAANTHVEPNPHASHQGKQECKVCHRAHEPSVDDCGRCHATSWTVP